MGGVVLSVDELGFPTQPMFVYVGGKSLDGRQHTYTFSSRCALCGAVAAHLGADDFHRWTQTHVPDLSNIGSLRVRVSSCGGSSRDRQVDFPVEVETTLTHDATERADARLVRTLFPPYGEVSYREAAARLLRGDACTSSPTWKPRLELCRELPVHVPSTTHLFTWASEPERSILCASVHHVLELVLLARCLQHRMLVRAATGVVPVDLGDYVLIEAVTCAILGRELFLPGPVVPWDQGGLNVGFDPRWRAAPAFVRFPEGVLRAACAEVRDRVLMPWTLLRSGGRQQEGTALFL